MVHPLRFTTMHNYPHVANPRVHRKAEKIKTRAKAGHRLYLNFTPVTEGRSMKDACGCLVLESFNTTRGVRVGRQHRSKSKRQCVGKKHREEERKIGRWSKGERAREKGNISDDWYCRRCARCGVPWGGIDCIQMGWPLELC